MAPDDPPIDDIPDDEKARFVPISEERMLNFERTVKRPKYGGRKKGALNKKTLQKLFMAEKEVLAVRKGKRMAIDHMDEMIGYFERLVRFQLNPWNIDGTKKQDADEAMWFRCVEVFQSFLNMRAPYQSPRLSALALMPSQARQKTTVNVTILNERGEKVFSDAEREEQEKAAESNDFKQIEAVANPEPKPASKPDDEEAA